MSIDQAHARLAAIASLQVTRNEPLARHTRFGIGGPASIFIETADEAAFVGAARAARESGLPWMVIGMGTNLVVADAGYRGIALRYSGAAMKAGGLMVRVQAGAALQDLVDFTVGEGLQGLESMTGIPGNVGAAVYGNAGAYGTSISDVAARVRYFDGDSIRETDSAGCGFRYRDSIFKRNRLEGHAWLILSAEFQFQAGEAEALRTKAAGILETRNRKYPPEMKCAGSIFKNLLLASVPESARADLSTSMVKGGKVPTAWFLEQVGAKGLANGGIRVTDDHANTLYNAGGGTAAQLRELIGELKRRVRVRYGLILEEEIQYAGFEGEPRP
ncbi:MAG: UDP-N-acetylmuramate dehydrogenase [Candidatus Solibacter usitatus]|nr:UDP-N-acetylmuramate dehydrogenase [Candidatus Solibacter usitatus]